MNCLDGFSLLVGRKIDEIDNRHALVADVVTALHSFAVKDHKAIKTVVQNVRGLLNQPSFRQEGLTYLSQLVQQSSFPVFDENYQSWFVDVRQFIKNDAGEDNCLMAVKILCVIIECGVRHPDSLRWLGLNIPQCIPQLLALSEQHETSVVIGLSAVMTHLPGSSRSSLGKIHRRVLRLLVSSNVQVVELASALLARFPFSGQGGEGGKGHAEAWLQLYSKLRASLHVTLNDLYNGLELDRYDVGDLGERLEFPVQFVNFGIVDSTSLFIAQYREVFALCKCLSNLLNVNCSVPLTIPIETTLHLVCRILKVTGKTIITKKTQDSRLILLYSILPILHAETMRWLENLIVNCTTHLLVHDATIQGLVVQTLQWTSSVRSNEDWRHSLGKLRQSAYQVMSTWISVSGGSADLQLHGDSIVGQLLRDIVVEESNVNLAQHEVKDTNAKKPPKAKRQRMDPNFVNANALRENVKESVEPGTCLAALKTLRVLLYAHADDLQAETHKNIQARVSKVLAIIQRSQNTAKLYADPSCRRALYSVLHATLINDPFLLTSQLASAIHWFTTGKLDVNVKVSQTCIEALAACRLIMHPPRRIFNAARVVVETAKEFQGVSVDDEEDNEEMIDDVPNFASPVAVTSNVLVDDSERLTVAIETHAAQLTVAAEIVSNGEVPTNGEGGPDVNMVAIELGSDDESDVDVLLIDIDEEEPVVTCAVIEGNTATKAVGPTMNDQLCLTTTTLPLSDSSSVRPITENGGEERGVIRSNGLSSPAAVQHSSCNGNAESCASPLKTAATGPALDESGVKQEIIQVGEGAATNLADSDCAQDTLDRMLDCFVPCLPDDTDAICEAAK